MIWVLFLCFLSTKNVLTQNVAWTVGSPVIIFGKSLYLNCTVDAFCCNTSLRIWEKEAGTQILNDGQPGAGFSKKYEEDWDGGTTGFNLIIKKLDLNDADKDYDCQYRLGNDKHNLSLDDTWEYPPTEECPNDMMKSETDGCHTTMRLTGTLNIARSAPSPSVIATYGGNDVTADLNVTILPKFENWFYNFTVSIDRVFDCYKGEKFTLSVVTGTTTTTICDVDICKCEKCAATIFGFTCILHLLGSLALIQSLLQLCGVCLFGNIKGSEKKIVWMMLAVFVVFDFGLLNVLPAVLTGLYACPCQETWLWYLFSLLPILSGVIFIFIIHALCVFDTEYLMDNHQKKTIFGLFTGGIPIIYAAVIDKKCYKCDDTGTACERGLRYSGLMVLTILIFPIPFLIIYYFYWKDDDTSSYKKGLRYSGIVVLASLILPIPFLIVYLSCTKGGKNQSVESGSSCWPICRVGQDPNTSSSGPEEVRRSPKKERADKKPTDFARSPENERADKKKDRKPTEVVRPQPTRPLPPMHLKTDNTGRAEYSTETEIFKPPALPSINKASDSPRPLPQKPPVTQLDPLRESTSERKKKKKRKKKEAKQSDEEN